ADSSVRVQRTRQHAISVCQALTDHEFRKTGAFGLKQFLDITQGHAVTCSDCRNAEISVIEMSPDVCLDGLQARHPNPALSGNFSPIGCRAKGHRSEIIDMCHSNALQFDRS